MLKNASKVGLYVILRKITKFAETKKGFKSYESALTLIRKVTMLTDRKFDGVFGIKSVTNS